MKLWSRFGSMGFLVFMVRESQSLCSVMRQPTRSTRLNLRTGLGFAHSHHPFPKREHLLRLDESVQSSLTSGTIVPDQILPPFLSTNARRLYASPPGSQSQEDLKNYESESIDVPTTELSPLSRAVQSSVASLLDNMCRHIHDDNVPVVITLSVSGGCDSVALFHACMEWRNSSFSSMPPMSIQGESDISDRGAVTFQVVHFNHEQRGDESDADCRFVQSLCEDYGIPCLIERWSEHVRHSHGDPASSPPVFAQDTARRWRRSRLTALTKSTMESVTLRSRATASQDTPTFGMILTAHHKDDSVESLLLKAIRGVHLLNLSGMQEAAEVSSNIFLLRPWVQDFRKQDLVNYLQERQLGWREDESNTSPKYLRNRIRNELIPLLQDLTSGSLESKVDSLIDQSQELAGDITPRVLRHLNQVFDEESNSYFDWDQSTKLLSDGQDSPLIQSQALFRWMTIMANTAAHSNCQVSGRSPSISNHSLQRLLKQLRNYPDQTQWTIEVGQNQNVQRQGGVLRYSCRHLTDFRNGDSSKELDWTLGTLGAPTSDHDTGAPSESDFLVLHIDPQMISNNFKVSISTLKELEMELQRATAPANGDTPAIWFTPPWKTSQVKLRQFLRGQNVPLHVRDSAKVVVVRNSTPGGGAESLRVAAVQVPVDKSMYKWILHRDFKPTEEEIEGQNNEESQSPAVPISVRMTVTG